MKMLLLLLPLTLAACESDFIADPARPRPTRAVQSPIERSDASNETLGGGAPAVPLITIDAANTKDESPQIHTIADPLRPAPTPTTRPTPAPAAVPNPPRTVDPILGQ